MDGAASGGPVTQPPAGDRGNGQTPAGADNAGFDGGGRSRRKPQSRKSPAMGGADEQSAPTGGGDNSPGAGIGVNSVQLNLFDIVIPSEQQQRAAIANAAPVLFKQKFSQQETDNVLRFGCNEKNARMEIAAEFSKQKPLAEKAAYLQNFFE